MESCRAATIDAFNSYVASLAAGGATTTRLSLTTFDSESIDTVIAAARITDVPKLTHETFVPRASTPLFDAIGKVVAVIDKTNTLPGERVALTILTDGQENASREMSADAVRKMLLDRQERLNWLVQYLGANQNAWASGAQIGIAAAHAMDFDIGHVQAAMGTAAASARRYAAATVRKAREAASFTPTERESAKPKPKTASKPAS